MNQNIRVYNRSHAVFIWYFLGKLTTPIFLTIYRITAEGRFRITASGNRRVTAGSP